MKVLYNQLLPLRHITGYDHTEADGTLTDAPAGGRVSGRTGDSPGQQRRNYTGGDRSGGRIGSSDPGQGGNRSGGGIGGGTVQTRPPPTPTPIPLTPNDLPDHPTDYIAGLIPDYSDVELDYFGLAQEASDYNLPKIDENLARAVEVAGPLAKQLTRSNTQSYQTTMDALLPGNQGLINASTRRAQQNLSGRIGSETESAILRGGARRALQSGVGFGSGRSSNLTARDLGLFSEDLQNTGFAQAQQMYGQAATTAQSLMVRQSDLASNLQDQYNQGSLLTPGQALEGESANITSKFNISSMQIANAQNAYEAKYNKTSDKIAYAEAQAAREYQAAQARKERKSSLFSTIISGVAGIAANAVLPGIGGMLVGAATKSIFSQAGPGTQSGMPVNRLGQTGGSGRQQIELFDADRSAFKYTAPAKRTEFGGGYQPLPTNSG